MRIHFLVNEVQGGWSPTDKRLGGTEESVVKWAEELAKRNDGGVVVWKNGGTMGNHNDVTYMPRESYGGLDGSSFWLPGICINIKSSEIDPKEPTLYLTNEVDADKLDLSRYDGVIWPSQWAVDNIPVNNKTYVVPHGYDETKIYPTEKVDKLCIYTSSPDRGLDTLEQIWPSVVDKHPDAQLLVTYGAKDSGIPNAGYVDLSEEAMNELYKKADVWIHPASGGELFGISGLKAQAAGAIPVYFPTMALVETVKDGIACSSPGDMYHRLVELLDNKEEKSRIRARLAKLELPTWKTSTDALEDVIINLCRLKSKTYR